METGEYVNIHLQIDGYTIPYRVLRKDEAPYRRAAKLVDELINEYRTRYQASLATKKLSAENLLILVAFQFAVGAIGSSGQEAKEPILARIDQYAKELEALLQE